MAATLSFNYWRLLVVEVALDLRFACWKQVTWKSKAEQLFFKHNFFGRLLAMKQVRPASIELFVANQRQFLDQ